VESWYAREAFFLFEFSKFIFLPNVMTPPLFYSFLFLNPHFRQKLSFSSEIFLTRAPGVYPLAILVAVLSGFWPYAKLVLMLICWVMPQRLFSFKMRENCLMVLDALGKWSLIDAYVLIMMLVAFRFRLSAPAVSEVALDIFVQPHWGFYTFLAATMVSLILSHVILHFHRTSTPPVDETVKNLEAELDLAPNSLSTEVYLP
jgi:hypothetical protein